MDTKESQNNRPRSVPGSRARLLDQDAVRALAVPDKGSHLYFDAEIPGFCCLVSHGGTKSFRLRYRKTEGGAAKWFSVKIGRWRDAKEIKKTEAELRKREERKDFVAPDPAEIKKFGLTAGQARLIASGLSNVVQSGGNPAQAARMRALGQQKAAAGAVTVAAAFKRYLDEGCAHMKESSRVKVESSFKNHILPRLGSRMVASLEPADVRTLLVEVKKARVVKGRKAGGQRAAGLSGAHLSSFLNWASSDEAQLVASNVVKQVSITKIVGEENKRERYLSREEWAAVMHELDEWPHWVRRGARNRETIEMRLDEPQLRQLVSCEVLRVALLTGARKGEVMRMRWTDVKLNEGWWIKPAETTKSSKKHEVAIPRLAIESLRKLQAAHGDPVFVFPGKARLDAITSGLRLKGTEGGPVQDVHELWGRIRAKLGIEDVRVHDLRHTHASVLISNGGTLDDVRAQLGHSQVQTTARYAHLFDERKHRNAAIIDAFAAENPNKPQSGGPKPLKRPNRTSQGVRPASTTVR